MKNKISKSWILAFSIVATMLIQSSVRAEINLGDVTGAAWTIGDIIVGQITIHPAYAVETWYHRSREQDTSSTQKYKRARITGDHFYHSKSVTPLGVTENNDPFPIDSVNKLNINCQYNPGNGQPVIRTSTVEHHTEYVWIASFEETGSMSHNGPWTIWLKASGQRIGGCTPRAPVDLYFWVPATVGKSFGQSVTLGSPNCTLNYPFYLASDFYK